MRLIPTGLSRQCLIMAYATTSNFKYAYCESGMAAGSGVSVTVPETVWVSVSADDSSGFSTGTATNLISSAYVLLSLIWPLMSTNRPTLNSLIVRPVNFVSLLRRNLTVPMLTEVSLATVSLPVAVTLLSSIGSPSISSPASCTLLVASALESWVDWMAFSISILTSPEVSMEAILSLLLISVNLLKIADCGCWAVDLAAAAVFFWISFTVAETIFCTSCSDNWPCSCCSITVCSSLMRLSANWICKAATLESGVRRSSMFSTIFFKG